MAINVKAIIHKTVWKRLEAVTKKKEIKRKTGVARSIQMLVELENIPALK